tara:strand:+ start:101 stop:874 length:774 start_codon:yes stop_codon:yes gene_type:complete
MDDAENYYRSLIGQGYPEPVAESFTETYFPGYLAYQLAKKQQFISQNHVENNVPNIANQTNFKQNNNHITASPYNQQISGTGINDGLYIVSTQTTKSSTSKILFIAAISIVALVAISVVFAGVMYVWAANLAEENDDQSIEGTWYNVNDTMTFYPNGTVTESTNTFMSWQTTDGDLVIEFFFDDNIYEIELKYTIRDDTDGNEILFLAYYEYVDGEKTSNMAPEQCYSYSSSVLGSDPDYAETVRAVIPTWCELVEE